MPDRENLPQQVVIIGAGFAGLNAALKLAKEPVRITIIDKKNHHTFQPLLYQVALAVLSPAEIASPIRAITRKQKNTEVLLDEVVDFDLPNRRVILKNAKKTVAFDYLIVAAGAGHAYFGHPEWEKDAPGLKTVEDALEIRRRVLEAFEQAEKEAILGGELKPLNFVIIGAGATGVELAGAITDIAKRYMVNDFRGIDPTRARVILLEGGPSVLSAYPPDLQQSAKKQLEELGVEVRLNAKVTHIEPGAVMIGSEQIQSRVTLWAAGVAASPLGKKLGVATDKAGRVLVAGDLSIPGHKDVFVLGDLASYLDKNGKPVPGVAPAAIQMGKFAAATITRDLNREPRKTFHYLDKGSLATIGRSKAVAELPGVHASGVIAWLLWLGVHIAFLIGFRNRILVMMEWAWAYFTFNRGARLITDK
jgi:NADH:ubiquinone reductase (H+-translocating)